MQNILETANSYIYPLYHWPFPISTVSEENTVNTNNILILWPQLCKRFLFCSMWSETQNCKVSSS